jgi:NAD(P)H dehydrogenase (quinone)
MPKLLVLFPAGNAELAPLANAVAEGARRVRFAEVDLRTLGRSGDGATAGKPLERIEELASYDGVILGVPTGDAQGVLEGVARFDGSLTDKVGSAFTTRVGKDRVTGLWSALGMMADRGMILVPVPFDEAEGSGAEACRQMGKRVAEVIGWLTHARSHHHHQH